MTDENPTIFSCAAADKADDVLLQAAAAEKTNLEYQNKMESTNLLVFGSTGGEPEKDNLEVYVQTRPFAFISANPIKSLPIASSQYEL